MKALYASSRACVQVNGHLGLVSVGTSMGQQCFVPHCLVSIFIGTCMQEAKTGLYLDDFHCVGYCIVCCLE